MEINARKVKALKMVNGRFVCEYEDEDGLVSRNEPVSRNALLGLGKGGALEIGRKMNLLLEAGNIAFWHDINFEEKIEDFLFPLAEKTRENYNNGIKHYLKYCSFIGVSPGNDDNEVALGFRKWLEDWTSPGKMDSRESL